MFSVLRPLCITVSALVSHFAGFETLVHYGSALRSHFADFETPVQYGSALVSHFAGFETVVQYGSALVSLVACFLTFAHLHNRMLNVVVVNRLLRNKLFAAFIFWYACSRLNPRHFLVCSFAKFVAA